MLQSIKTAAGLLVDRTQQAVAYPQAILPIVKRLDAERGAVFTSGVEFPGRYTRWDIGFVNPPLVLSCKAHTLHIQALNRRGEQVLAMISPMLYQTAEMSLVQESSCCSEWMVIPSEDVFSEETRSQQPSVFSLLRRLLAWFRVEDEPYLGLYGAFGYDLIFQFEAIHRHQQRSLTQRDMVLYLPDEIMVVDHRKETAFIRRYDLRFGELATHDLPRDGEVVDYTASEKPIQACDHAEHEYEQLVKTAKTRFACGDLFEVVPSQTFYSACSDNPSHLFERMCVSNPAPYGFLINLGQSEYLVGASPEMYVRVQGRRVETSPISGTIERGADAIEDAINIQSLLQSEKEASELTMCTDVDRNDKSRICEAGSVRVIGRRQIEMYSRLIHTVDHVEGVMREGFDAVDAFLTHMWVVTVTGAPKLWAMNFIEQHEKSPRKWYGGAVGWFGFDGDLNTGLVLRTVRLQGGVAEVRVGATLLYDSVPEAEEQETRLKASALLALLQGTNTSQRTTVALPQYGLGKTVLLVDHQDSFVHTLANYIRQTGASVETVRSDHVHRFLAQRSYDLVVLSPGPGKPSDFALSATIQAVCDRGIPLFGVCLGLQGLIEYFGGDLDVLDYPMHGKSSTVYIHDQHPVFADFPPSFTAARYHSLHARLATMPKELMVTAMSDDGVVMAIAHRQLPIQAVQFHPEAILSLPQQAGMRLISNLMAWVADYG